MTVSIIDGHVGTPHVTSDDLEATNVALYEAERGVLPWGDRFACHMSDANHAVVSSGAGIVRGRRFVIHELETVEIASGSQGQRRSDLIVARYAKDDSGVESVSLVAVTGTPGASATDPELEDGDLPLWRVTLEGVNVGEPQQAFEATLPSLSAAGGSSSSGPAEAALRAARAANAAAAQARAVAESVGRGSSSATAALESTMDDLARRLVTLTGDWFITGECAYGPSGKMAQFGDTLSLPTSTASGETMALG